MVKNLIILLLIFACGYLCGGQMKLQAEIESGEIDNYVEYLEKNFIPEGNVVIPDKDWVNRYNE